MCGIAGHYGSSDTGEVLLDMLKRLEYRGYDSTGAAFLSGSDISTVKGTGDIEKIKENVVFLGSVADGGIGHTRWATHGRASDENAHPHSSCENRFSLVHNGIIENHRKIKSELGGHKFYSETDSEVAVHYIEEKSTLGVENAVVSFMEKAKGSYAVALMDSKEERVFLLKNGSPLAIGIGKKDVFIASDPFAFHSYTDRVLFLRDGEYAVVDNCDVTIKNLDGAVQKRKPEVLEWKERSFGKNGYRHYMQKEIREIPGCIERLEKLLETVESEKVDGFIDALLGKDKVVLTASGTSHHASMLGSRFLRKVGVDARVVVASEFGENFEIDEETLLLAVSQSGETKDVLDAIETARKMGADIASITNTPHSTIQRRSDVNLGIHAGREFCVAATKTFTNQVYTLRKISKRIRGRSSVGNLPSNLKNTIKKNGEAVKKVAEELKNKEDIYILGKGEMHPVAEEISLKLKEIAYIHAEGMMGGELKHGTLALIEEGTPVISLVPRRNSDIVSNLKEVKSRGANSIEISPFSDRFELPDEDEDFIFFSAVLGFMLTYWIGRKKGLPVDRPRNLAKSVTVR